MVGAPNCGKTTLFNWLTGGNYKTVNYPGSTVDISRGKPHAQYKLESNLMDTPGIYSLDAKSPDEVVTCKALFETHPPDLIIAVVDATQFARQLPVALQLKDSGFNIVIALTMIDLLPALKKANWHELENQLGAKIFPIDGQLGGGVFELVKHLHPNEPKNKTKPIQKIWSLQKIDESIKSSQQIFEKYLGNKAQPPSLLFSQKLDKFFLHPFFGLITFIFIMSLLFTSIFWLSTPLMDIVDNGFTWLAQLILSGRENSLLAQMLSDGIVTSVGSVAVFIPQIFILFVGIILLEDTGYLARSAVLVDKPFSWLGMGGRSFVPLLSGFACAVPAMMAARTISSKRERFITLFVIPLMTCSARLPVYALLLSILFWGESAWKPGLALAGLYFISVLVGALAAKIISLIIPAEKNSFFILELPIFRKPKPLVVLRQSLGRTKSYILRAGPAIFIFAFLIWGATTFPHYEITDRSERLEQSYAGQVGKVIEPLFEPMGGDWRTGVALMSAFAAREIFVSSLAVVFKVTDEEDSQQESLLKTMNTATDSHGKKLFTFSSIVGLIAFFMLALQCLSTVSIAIREFGDKKMALIQLFIFTLSAYIIAVSLVQGLRHFGVA